MTGHTVFTASGSSAAPVRGAAWIAVLRTEFRLYLRDPIGPLWGVLVPVAAFAVLGAVTGLRDPVDSLGGASYLEIYLSTLPLLAATMTALAGLPQVVATYRERGVLRRYGVTPMRPSAVLGAQLVVYLGAALLAGVLVLLIAAVADGVGPGAMTWGWLLALTLSIGAVLGLGLLVAAVTPTAKVAGAVGTVLFFPLMFGAGLWIPLMAMPPVMRGICQWTPLGAADRAMVAAVVGDVPPASALLALAGYAVVLWWLAVRCFRWS